MHFWRIQGWELEFVPPVRWEFISRLRKEKERRETVDRAEKPLVSIKVYGVF